MQDKPVSPPGCGRVTWRHGLRQIFATISRFPMAKSRESTLHLSKSSFSFHVLVAKALRDGRVAAVSGS
ncbi:hypothetical protein K4H00_21225, partial [Mycobacterium tuberculosis]|nr:hypothetical protein [Mycobacterium tuberculosis]